MNIKGKRLSKREIEKRLDADGGLMREKLKYLGIVALKRALTEKGLTRKKRIQMQEALTTLREIWLRNGYGDLRDLELKYNFDVDVVPLPSKRGMKIYDEEGPRETDLEEFV